MDIPVTLSVPLRFPSAVVPEDSVWVIVKLRETLLTETTNVTPSKNVAGLENWLQANVVPELDEVPFVKDMVESVVVNVTLPALGVASMPIPLDGYPTGWNVGPATIPKKVGLRQWRPQPLSSRRSSSSSVT